MILKNLIICSLFLLSGCQSTTPIIKNSITFVVGPSDLKNNFVFKNKWPECGNLSGTPDLLKNQKHITDYNFCKVSPEGYIPEQIIIKYASWLTMKDVQEKLGKYPQKDLSDIVLGFANENQVTELKKWYLKQEKLIENIPITAWKRIILNPPKEVEKYKYKFPEGKGNRRRGKEIHYRISLHPDGSHTIETKLYWVEKYQMSWN